MKRMNNWQEVKNKFNLIKENFEVIFLDEIQFMDSKETIANVEEFLKKFSKKYIIKKIHSRFKQNKKLPLVDSVPLGTEHPLVSWDLRLGPPRT